MAQSRSNWFPGLGRRASFSPATIPGLALDLRTDTAVYSDDAGTIPSTDANFCGQFASGKSLTRASNSGLQTGLVDWFFAAWVYIDASPAYKTVASKADTGNYEYYLGFSAADKPTLNIYTKTGGAANAVVAASAVPVETWVHVVAGLDVTANRLFLIINNGTPVYTTLTLTPEAGAADLAIGDYQPGSAVYDMVGRIDNAVFGKPPTTITSLLSAISSALYNGGAGIKPSTLSAAQRTAWGVVSGWDLDNREGITADSIGSNTLTNVNAVTHAQGVSYAAGEVGNWGSQAGGLAAVQASANQQPAYVTGAQGGKPLLLLDGVDDLLGYTATDLATAHSAFAVLKPNSLASGIVIGAALPTDYALAIDATNVMYGAQGQYASVAHGLTANCAAILGVTRSGTSVQFWKNGAALGAAQTLGADNTLTVSTVGCAADGTYPFSGYIGDTLAYTTVITASQSIQVCGWLNTRFGVY